MTSRQAFSTRLCLGGLAFKSDFDPANHAMSSLSSMFGLAKQPVVETNQADINIFTVASGLLYEVGSEEITIADQTYSRILDHCRKNQKHLEPEKYPNERTMMPKSRFRACQRTKMEFVQLCMQAA